MEVEESLNIELECSLCVRVFNEPITLGCGHTFCRHCLLQAMQHNNQCPLCRQSYFIDPRTHPVSITIRNIVEKTHPHELNARKQETVQIIEECQKWDYLLPIFPLDAVVFPGSEFPMLIFEHRYQKMLKSILQGHRMFGLVAITPDEGNPSGFSPSSIGCSLMVTDCTTKMDGQFVIKVRGIQRFKIVDHWIKDQYIMARVEMIEEVYPDAEELSAIAALADKINTVITSYNQFPSAKSSIVCQLLSKNLRKLKRSIPQLGTENTAEQLTAFTYWLCQNLPSSLSSKQFLLEEMSLMNRILGVLEMMRAIYPFECFRSTDEFLMQLQMQNQERLQLMLERELQLQQQQQSAMEEFCASVQKSSDSPSPLLHSHSHSSASTSVSEMSIASLIN